MLSKLLKYDLRANLKIFLFIWPAILVFGLLERVEGNLRSELAARGRSASLSGWAARDSCTAVSRAGSTPSCRKVSRISDICTNTSISDRAG